MPFPLNRGQITALISQALASYDEPALPYHERNAVANVDYKTRVDASEKTFTVVIFDRSDAL